jgi:hypothetical protein
MLAVMPRHALRTAASAAFFAFALASATPQGAFNAAQPSSAELSLQQPAEFRVGDSAVPLYGPWKFTIGDSPIDPKTGKPLWAEPEFDDSKWETVDLRPKDGAADPFTAESGYVPGWTAKGHPRYSGYAWYRIRVRAENPSGKPLSLAGADDVDDGYQVFADGELAGSFGNFTEGRPVTYFSQPASFRLPEHPAASNGTRVLAFRFWMNPVALLNVPDAGGMHMAPVLGEAGVIALLNQSRWVTHIRTFLAQAILAVAFGLMAVVVFSLISFDRSDPVYFWMGLLFLVAAADYGTSVTGDLSELLSIRQTQLVLDFTDSLIDVSWCIVWWTWFGRIGFRWLPRVVAALTVLRIASTILGQELIAGLLSHQAALGFVVVNRVLVFTVAALLVWIAIDGIRRHGLDGWLVLPLVLLEVIADFQTDLARLHIPLDFFPFGMFMTLGDMADPLIIAVIAFLLLRRLVASIKRQRQIALDVKSAQEVQQVILPEPLTRHGELVVESEYRPAREVGGDFYQVIPNEKDGSLLIVAGDVAGKGLQAGMLVALLVGAIRMAAEVNPAPLFVLQALNRRLLGRGGAHATCLALSIEVSGEAVLANAGHLPPYLNGKPVEIEGSVPLGFFAGAEFSVLRFHLGANDRLVLTSDGLAEATDPSGSLFGFEAVEKLAGIRASAVQIANTAQEFGQEDDISVIAVTRLPVPVSA